MGGRSASEKLGHLQQVGLALLAVALLCQCGGEDPVEPAGRPGSDAAEVDGSADAGLDAGDSAASPPDAGEAADARSHPDAPDGTAGADAAPLDGGLPPGAEQVEVGEFLVRWEPERVVLSIRHTAEPGHVLWSSIPGEPLLKAGWAELRVEERRGSFRVDERIERVCIALAVDGFEQRGDSQVLGGRLGDQLGNQGCNGTFEVVFSQPRPGHLAFSVQAEGLEHDVLILNYASPPSEKIYGFGEQFTHLQLKGHVVPILVQEGGIGRGRFPISDAADIVSPGSGGDAYTSYAPLPHYLTNQRRSLFLEGSEYAVFDLSALDRVVLRVHAPQIRGRILYGGTLLQLVERFTEYSGRMPEPPAWLDDGAVVGMQGGTERVRQVWRQLQEHDAPLAAFWLQDWVGKRRTSIGSQLWWHWVLDEVHYPGWEQLVADLHGQGVRVLGYVNPFLVDPAARCSGEQGAARPDCDAQGRYLGRNLLEEALLGGHLVQKQTDGGELEPYELEVTDFPTYLLDLSRAETRAWFSQVIVSELLGSGLDGWMADFGEALPFDATLGSGEPASLFHNLYPVSWARLNRETLQDSGLEGEALFFTRAGYTGSSGQSTMFWTGDQMVTWDEHDGFRSAIKGLLSGGISGISLNHSDSGGYTSASFELRGRSYGFVRHKSLLLRWTEANAFTALLRTHEGNQPEANVQLYSDEETLAHFAHCARVYKALAPYRRRLLREAAERGWPVVRHPVLHFPDDQLLAELDDDNLQFMLGDQLMVAPVLDKDAQSRRVYLPAGIWVDFWSGERHGRVNSRGGWYQLEAPYGKPPVLYRDGSQELDHIAQTLRQPGVGH